MARKKKFTAKTVSASEYGITASMVDEYALEVIKKLQENGYDGYIVGGGIRDLLLDKTPKDFDVVTNATPEEVRKIFRRNSIIIGRRFRIVHVIYEQINYDKLVYNRPLIEKHIIEISTYRSLKVHDDSLSELGRIMYDNNYGVQPDDAQRRDFTINALYYDPIHNIIVDYSNGLDDIKHKTIRMIGDPTKRYIEDPVRILRVIRLSIKLGLNIETDTLGAIADTKNLLANENRGRLFEETLKVLLSGYSKTCINAIKSYKLPAGVFPIFDKVFFKKNTDSVAISMLNKTDERIRDGHNVSAVFILAGILWHLIYKRWNNSLHDGSSPRQALCDTIIDFREYAIKMGITRNMYNSISEIWLLQYEFENPVLKKLLRIVKNSRFRQGLYLYNIRMELNEVEPSLNKWWNEFLELTDEEEKLVYIEKLKTVCDTVIKPKKRKRKKTKSS